MGWEFGSRGAAAINTATLLHYQIPKFHMAGLGLGHASFPLAQLAWGWVTSPSSTAPHPPHRQVGVVPSRLLLHGWIGAELLPAPFCVLGWGPVIPAPGQQIRTTVGSGLWIDQTLPIQPTGQKG